MVKANHKQLKAILTSRVRKFGPFFLVLKLGKFPLFDNFFFDLANFWDLDNFLVFNNYLYFSINLLSLSMPSILSMANTLLAINIYHDIIVFSIDVCGAAILLKF